MEISRIETSPLSEKDILEKFNVDTIRWELDKLEHGHWMAQQKDPAGNPVLIDMYRTLAKLKLKHPILAYEDIIKQVFASVIPERKDMVIENTANMLWALFHTDLHFDRLGIPKNYLKKIDDRTIELAKRMEAMGMDKLLYANMGDYFNSDHNRRTTKGTEQVNGIDEQESWKRWLHHQYELFHNLNKIVPTEFIYNPGNHDQFRLQYLSDAMALMLGEDVIDNKNAARKYREFWDNSIWFQHGHDTAIKNLLEVFTQEAKIKKHNFMFQWHLHQEIQKRFWPLLFECIGNEAPVSEREKRKWYIAIQKMKGILFDKKKGKVAELYI